MIVYKITNIINNKLYFGITKCSLNKRWNEHKCKSKSCKSHLYLSIKKYGITNFIIEKICDCETEDEMYDLEIYFIKTNKTNNPKYGYNNSSGGEVSSKGKKLSNETKLKISNYQKQRVRKPHSEETKKNMSIASKGRDMSLAVKSSALKRKGKPSLNRKKVILNDKVIFDSLTEASIKTGIKISTISNNLKGLSKKTKYGIWKVASSRFKNR